MKFKKLIAGALVGVMCLGAFGAYAQMSDNTKRNDESVTQVSDSREAELKKIAADAFKNYFNDKINPKDLEVVEANLKDQKAYLAKWNENDSYRQALINDEDDRILHLQSTYGQPETEDYKNYSSADAKEVAEKFIRENNILLSKDYTLMENRGIEMNENEDLLDYFFYFQYDGDKECLVTVNKEHKKVNQFILFDEHNGPREEDKVSDEDRAVKKEDQRVDLDENKVKKIASDAFDEYFNVEISVDDLEIQQINYNDEKAYDVFHTDVERNSIALITADYELMDLESNTGMAEGEDYQNYTYDEAKTVVMDFVKETNLLGKDYKFLGNRDELMKDMNEQKEAGSYYFSFQHDKNKNATIVVSKENEKVERFLLDD